MSAFIIGSTGLCGNFILKHAPEYYNTVYSLSRSEPRAFNSNSLPSGVNILAEKDAFNNWESKINESLLKNETNLENLESFFSGLATTAAQAGGAEGRHKIDYELNLKLAKVAKSKGFKKYIIISSLGANSNSKFSYLKTKGQLEDEIIKLNFDQTIILRPGVLTGERIQSKGFLENILNKSLNGIRNTRLAPYLLSPVSGEEVALAALKLSKSSNNNEKVVIVSGNEINKIANES
ncbi:hypothetical protein WICMUC_000875 [Wickerhamomyces mucosus]|uniref:NAD(P)-binding domain-containing protein n=1 Tax=Wickerhamomyces mucosus TaxID=1378264 RepID=A0A9P8PXR5_9ASCO|nr:hypothetical protein WICMUC_000875 [Wickerhamomyces mucosus]